MSTIVLNETGFVLLRPRVRDTEVTWAEVIYIRVYKIGGTKGMVIVCLDVGCEEGSFVSVDEEMEGYGEFLLEFPKHIEPDVRDWQEQVGSLQTGARAGYFDSYLSSWGEGGSVGGGVWGGEVVGSEVMVRPQFPGASGYDAGWAMENGSGPNPLWMMEWLTEGMGLKAGMRVLDLSCGKGLGSIFLAKEFGVTVVAAEWWVSATENAGRVEKMGVGGKVLPLRAKSHALPLAEGFFDAIVCVNAFHYFGTGDLYLGYLQKFLKKGGILGIAGPGVREELGEAGVPGHLKEYWQWSYWGLHSAGWWKRQLGRGRDGEAWRRRIKWSGGRSCGRSGVGRVRRGGRAEV